MMVLTNGLPLLTVSSALRCCSSCSRDLILSRARTVSSRDSNIINLYAQSPLKFKSSIIRIKCFQQDDSESYETATSEDKREGQDMAAYDVLGSTGSKSTSTGSSFLVKLIVVVGIVLMITLISIGLRKSNQGSLLGIHYLVDISSSSSVATTSSGFTFKVFRMKIMLPEYPPGGFKYLGLSFVPVGISLARMLSLDGSRQSFVDSFSRNAPYIVSTILWVYCDMIPFYLGKLFRQSGASDDVCSKLGIGKDRATSITRAVQRYGNLVGFVERFSLGVRNPTAFLAGAMDISPEFFFAGVCCGGFITLPVQLGIGFFMRERPVFALATVATVVGIWTVFPYVAAALTALFLYLRRRYSN